MAVATTSVNGTRLAFGQATVSVELITPTMAEEMLRLNKHNRHERASVRKRYARELAVGTFTLADQAISFDDEGYLVNGQHRLGAVMDAGVPLLSIVVRGLPQDAKANLDVGERRRLKDVLEWRGETDANSLAAVVRMCWKYDKGEACFRDQKVSPSNSDALAYLDAHPTLREAVNVGRRTGMKVPVLTASVLAAVFHLAWREAPDDAVDFMQRLASGAELPEGSPILALRRWAERVARKEGHFGRPSYVMQMAVTIQAMNAWRKGDSRTIVKWKVGGANPDSFPLILKEV